MGRKRGSSSGSSASSTQGHIFMRVSSASCLAYPVGKKAGTGKGNGRQGGGTARGEEVMQAGAGAT